MRNQLPASVLTKRIHPRTEDIRGPYFRDQTAIIHSTSFRRLKHKTQALFAPENDHVCTRIEHVLHVATIASSICRGLNRQGWELDDDLAYAAGLGHDLGHAPFGHSGERALSKALGAAGETFSHEIQSLRIVDRLANSGKGLNLTYGVRDAILCHDGETFEQYLVPDTQPTDPWEKLSARRISASLEGSIVRFSDKIAYLGRDLEDALRVRLVTQSDVPAQIAGELGNSNGEIINALVLDLIENSHRENRLGFSDRCFALVAQLREFNYKQIYRHPEIARYESYCYEIVNRLFTHVQRRVQEGLPQSPALLIDDYLRGYLERMKAFHEAEQTAPLRVCADFVSGMTDNFAIKCYEELVLPRPLQFG